MNDVEQEEEQQEDDEKKVQDVASESKSQDAFKYVLKRNKNFMCLATDTIKCLDIVNYNAPRITYAMYLSVYKIIEEKGVFCYECIRDLKSLEDR